MATFYPLCLRNLRSCLLKRPYFPVAKCNRLQSVTTNVEQKPDETFDEKNARLNRPLSPHLTIYKFQITSVLSITHRFTGMTLGCGIYGLSIGMLFLPSSFPHYFQILQSMSSLSPLFYAMKFSLAWMFAYHATNGIRHLAWDLGYGFDMKTLHTTGYAVLGSSVLLAVAMASL